MINFWYAFHMSEFALPSLLRQLPYFAVVTLDQLDKLAEHAIRHLFVAGEIIFLEGEESAGLWVLKEGRVKAFKLSPDGQEFILRFFSPGDTFNELAAFDLGPNPASTMAITDVTAWVIPAPVFTAALKHDHELSLNVLHGMARRVRELVGRMEDLALHPVTARLARFLLEQIENPSLAHPAVTRVLIANHLATTPESISRSLRALEEAGAIRFDRHRIIIENLEILHQQAQL